MYEGGLFTTRSSDSDTVWVEPKPMEERNMKIATAWDNLIEACYHEYPDVSVEDVLQQGLSERRFFESLGRNLKQTGTVAELLSNLTLEDLAE